MSDPSLGIGTSRRVYDGDEVDDYIVRLHEHIDGLSAEITLLQEDTAALRAELAGSSMLGEDLEAAERALGRALLLAQRAADETAAETAAEVDRQRQEALERAHRDRSALVEAARDEAESIVASARQDAQLLTDRAQHEVIGTVEAARSEADRVVAEARSEAQSLLARARREAESLASDDRRRYDAPVVQPPELVDLRPVASPGSAADVATRATTSRPQAVVGTVDGADHHLVEFRRPAAEDPPLGATVAAPSRIDAPPPTGAPVIPLLGNGIDLHHPAGASRAPTDANGRRRLFRR